MQINIFQVPYDTARPDWRMGNGPARLLRGGLEDTLRAAGHTVTAVRIDSADPFPSEIKTAFELYKRLSESIRAGDTAAFPLVLSGNCGAALGTLAGISTEDTGIAWFDAHGDFNTPETTASGFLDGMGLAAASGLCWQKLTVAIPGFRPVPGRKIIHVGSSEIEQDEAALMRAYRVQVASLPAIREMGLEDALYPGLSAVQAQVSSVYLHLDLDVLDPTRTPANHFPASDGMDVEMVKEAIRLVCERFTIHAVGVASYDPACDPQGNTLRAAIELVQAVIG
jgi:arginase